MRLENCALQCGSRHIFTRMTIGSAIEIAMSCSQRRRALWIPAVQGRLGARSAYARGSGSQHLPTCSSFKTGVALSEGKKSDWKIIHRLFHPLHIELFCISRSQEHWPVIALFATVENKPPLRQPGDSGAAASIFSGEATNYRGYAGAGSIDGWC